MDLIRRVVPDDFNLFLYGDDHEGTTMRHTHGWEQLCHMLNSPYVGCRDNYAVDHGDICEAITIDDKRYDPATTSQAYPLLQMDQCADNRDPIQDRIVTILEGNHPLKLWKFGPITQKVCSKLGVSYGTWTAKIAWIATDGSLMFKSFHTHGRKSISSTADDPKRRMSNMLITLKRHLKFKAGDCALMCKGHTHKLLVCSPESELYLTDEGDKIKHHYTQDGADYAAPFIHPDHRWYVNTGSFYRLYKIGVSGYAECAEYDPIELGFAIAKIRDRKIIGIDKVVLQ